jgi:plasmid stabilization system protein ParE
MRIEYSKRATRELKELGEYYRNTAGPRVAQELEDRISAVIERVRRLPLSSPEVEQRPGLRVVLLITFPYKVFYRIKGDVIFVYHIRHTSRRRWQGR